MPKLKSNGTTGTHDGSGQVAELERRLEELERRLAILEARHVPPVRTHSLTEPAVDEALHPAKSEPDHVHDIEKPT